MFKVRYAVMMMLILSLVACASSEPNADSATPEATVPPATAAPAGPTAVPAEVEPTAVPTVAEATAIPTEAEPASSDLALFVTELQTALMNQDYVAMQALMSDPMVVGAWRSEGRTLTPDQMIEQFQNGSLPGPQAVQFSGLSDDELTNLIGQPPATLFGPDTNIVAALHSTGWGQSAGDEVILFVAEADGQFTWHAFLYTSGRFADASLGVVAAPVGLIYAIPDSGVYQIQVDGQPRQLLDGQTANTPNLQTSPDGRYAAYLTDDRQLWLIDTSTGDQQQLAGDFDLSNYLAWGDSNTLFIGVWLTPDEGEGPNNGHIATLSPETGDLQILDENRLSFNRPALAPDGETVAFTILPAGPDDSATSHLYQPDSGLEIFDPADFTATNELIDMPRFNPTWSPDGRKMTWLASTGDRFGLQLFDLEQQTVAQLFDWDPARFGAIFPSPTWSPDGRWLALEVWAKGPEGSGLWLLATDGSSQVLVDAQGRDPYWVNEGQLVFNVNARPRLLDVATSQIFIVELPEGSRVLGVSDASEMSAAMASEDIVAAVQAASPPQLHGAYPSPDGEWRAEIIIHECVQVDDENINAYEQLKLVRVDSGIEEVADSQLQNCGGLGASGFDGLFWSPNSRYFYFTTAREGFPDGCGYWQPPILRLDTIDQSITQLGGGSVSPDGMKLATWQEGELVVWDLNGGELARAAALEANTGLGPIVWSPDNDSLLYVQATSRCPLSGESYVVRHDLPDLEPSLVLESEAPTFGGAIWNTTNEIELFDENGNEWRYDFATEVLEQSP